MKSAKFKTTNNLLRQIHQTWKPANFPTVQYTSSLCLCIGRQANGPRIISKTILGIGHLLKPGPFNEPPKRHSSQPSLSVHLACSKIKLLPARLGGISLTISSSYAGHHFEASTRITSSIVALIALQGLDITMANLRVESKTCQPTHSNRNN